MSYQYNNQVLNAILADLGGTTTYPYDIDALNAIIGQLGGTGGHYYLIDAYNELCEIQSVTAEHKYLIDALNAINVAGDGTSEQFELPALVQLGAITTQIGSLVGIAPTNTAAQNVTAFNAAITRGNLYVDTVGVYEIDDTIFIPSNRKLEFVSGCTLKKKTGSSFSMVLANKGVLTATSNTNIKIYGNGLTVDINGIEVLPIITGLYGYIVFFRVTNFEIDGILTNDIIEQKSSAFFIHMAEVYGTLAKPSKISNISIHRWKDGIHFGVASDILLEDILTETGDDGIALNANDYAVCNPTKGNIERITIRRWTDNYYVGQGGSSCLLLSGSWTNWVTGKLYQENDTIISSGKIYQKSASGAATSSIAPTHTSGTVTGADGITWQFIQNGTLNHCDVKDIVFEDCVWNSSRPFIRTHGAFNEIFRPHFPGTFNQSIVDNITIDGITYNPYNLENLAHIDVNFGDLNIINSLFQADSTPVLLIPRAEGVAVNTVTFDNCDIDINYGSSGLITLSATNYLYTINAVSILNSQIKNIISPKSSLLIPLKINQFNTIILTNTIFTDVLKIVQIAHVDNAQIDVIGNGCSFVGKLERLIMLYSSPGAVTNFTSDSCTFEEGDLELFYNDEATAQLNVITTNSIGTIPNVSIGTVDISDCDLIPGMGDNIAINGDFKQSKNGYNGGRGALTWDSGEFLKYVSNDATYNNYLIFISLLNPLSNNLELTFRAKSPTLTNVLGHSVDGLQYTAVLNPALNTNWQDYKFTFARGASSGAFNFYLYPNLVIGTEIDMDSFVIKQV